MKQNQRGSAALLALFGVVGFFFVALTAAVVMYFSVCNYADNAEVGLNKVWTNNQNILGQYTLKVKEVASVPEVYAKDLQDVLAKEMSGRYGAEGSKANMQWIKEHAVNFDSSMYRKIQQVIEAGRNEFQGAQTRLIDEKAVYESALKTRPKSWILSMAGYPKVDMAKYKPIVAGDTAKAFETGVQEPVKLR